MVLLRLCIEVLLLSFKGDAYREMNICLVGVKIYMSIFYIAAKIDIAVGMISKNMLPTFHDF